MTPSNCLRMQPEISQLCTHPLHNNRAKKYQFPYLSIVDYKTTV